MTNSAARKLKRVPAGYLVIGVGPHKKKHATVAVQSEKPIFAFDIEPMLRPSLTT